MNPPFPFETALCAVSSVFPSSLSRCLQNARLMIPTSVPTKMAAMMVPVPTLPRLCNTVRQVMADRRTIVQSKPILTLENSICVTEETACIQPSPASGIRSAGKYKKIPNATNTVLASTMIMRIARFSGVGRKDTI